MSTTSQEQQLPPAFTIRPAVESDLPSTHAIYRHYALNTTIAFLLNDPPLEYITKRYHAAIAHGLPYLVAVASDSSPDPSNSSVIDPHHSITATDANSTATSNTPRDKILGFAHASPFSADKAGYAPSVEITIFCRPDSVSRGVGGALMTRLLADLQTCRNENWEAGHEGEKFQMPVRNVFAIVSQDVERRGEGAGEAKGEQIVQWYCRRFGFHIAGRMEGVGWKFGQEIDVLYLQKRLR